MEEVIDQLRELNEPVPVPLELPDEETLVEIQEQILIHLPFELREYLLKTYGWDAQTVGSHAGTSDTSQLLYVHPDGIRLDRLAPSGGGPDSGVNGDPTKASAAIGKIAVDIKVNAALAQYKTLKAASP